MEYHKAKEYQVVEEIGCVWKAGNCNPQNSARQMQNFEVGLMSTTKEEEK